VWARKRTLTSLQILLEILARNSCGNGNQSAVIPSAEVIARSATTWLCVRWSPCTPTDRIGRNTANACIHTPPRVSAAKLPSHPRRTLITSRLVKW
jgi:hypothetical protein